MLELYHGGGTTCSRKVRLCLQEKGVAYVSRFVDLHRFEQHEPAYLALNPDGVVPTLVHDGEPIVESAAINEYIDEQFDGPPLRPPDALGRARMRSWTRLADIYGPAAVVPHSWAGFKQRIDKIDPVDFERLVARIPLDERRDRWVKAARGGFDQSDMRDAELAARLIVERMEASLDGAWLMGDQYTLADIDLLPFLHRCETIYPYILNAASTPRVAGWLARMRARPAVVEVWNSTGRTISTS